MPNPYQDMLDKVQGLVGETGRAHIRGRVLPGGTTTTPASEVPAQFQWYLTDFSKLLRDLIARREITPQQADESYAFAFNEMMKTGITPRLPYYDLVSGGKTKTQLEQEVRGVTPSRTGGAPFPELTPKGRTEVFTAAAAQDLPAQAREFWQWRPEQVLREFEAQFPGAREAWWQRAGVAQTTPSPEEFWTTRLNNLIAQREGQITEFEARRPTGEGLVDPTPRELVTDLARYRAQLAEGFQGQAGVREEVDTEDPWSKFVREYDFLQKFAGTPARERGLDVSRVAPRATWVTR